jgi:hypothetical protein
MILVTPWYSEEKQNKRNAVAQRQKNPEILAGVKEYYLSAQGACYYNKEKE